jgi:hypothetical protein
MLHARSSRFVSLSFSKLWTVTLSMGLLALFAQSGRAADALSYTRSYMVTGDVASACVGGTRGTGVNGVTTRHQT